MRWRLARWVGGPAFGTTPWSPWALESGVHGLGELPGEGNAAQGGWGAPTLRPPGEQLRLAPSERCREEQGAGKGGI